MLLVPRINTHISALVAAPALPLCLPLFPLVTLSWIAPACTLRSTPPTTTSGTSLGLEHQLLSANNSLLELKLARRATFAARAERGLQDGRTLAVDRGLVHGLGKV